MDFRLNEEQQMLQDTVARLVRGEYSFEKRLEYSESELGFSESFWKQLGELGLMAVPFPEELGGFGGTGVEVQSVMTELGRGLCIEPYLQSVVLGGGLISQAGNEKQKEQWLAGIATGETQLAVGLQEPQSFYNTNDVETTAEKTDSGYVLNGRKAVVIGGHSANLLVVSARTSGSSRDASGISLFVIDANADGLERRSYPTIDGAKGCDLLLNNVKVGADALLGSEGEAADAIEYQVGRAISALCGEAVGVMEVACDLTLDYLKQRKQFGVPIGKFQVLQHRMADMMSELEQARSMAIFAASVADEPQSDERRRVIAAAKNVISRSAQFISEKGVQSHGGIGMTWEYNFAHYAKRLVMINHQLGDDDFHLERYAALLEAN
ncbi:MAG TPA: pimeloyl-CoA dehydrogenase small subunit [Marinobacter hydrocarbonoclasticus]|uniref:acyl-CoA dehydrogenase family protein n=1 Tax=Marinobacter TaxID=2742 RepID=UPI000C98FE51|nr:MULTISPECIES: acyl-CoA dehydrogenase [unclassified Marinobacter]MAC21124.1 pimeloyl-CoA dehydrogenase small subunit [Marinobacter sp.]HAX08512.1 pimeloyl-CoA dehydrogenase small subunit [Marinobacter nauticus]HCL37429.1 pimeloyl-CoA dehydrogenase small subunit [Marinobacter nauticus]HCR47896.1 pimeloyl-CoA dehydrogenase small subunit [Marinobacter nauticus]|tara:strand:- start:321 stop:1463 length:1143 start_codon:yes stop_codon:yes gene_type:complete